MDLVQARGLVGAIAHWHHKYEIFPGLTTPGSYEPDQLFQHLSLPKDCSGMRILDIGPSDGYFSMVLAQRGGDVTAVDFRPKNTHGFGVMETITGLKFTYIHANLYEIDVARLGTFDIVLFLGVLYHLPDMVRGLDIVRRLTRGRMFLETAFEPALTPGIATARYYEAATYYGDHTNFWAPNEECTLAMLRDVGFAPVHEQIVHRGNRLVLAADVTTDALRTEKMRIAYGQL